MSFIGGYGKGSLPNALSVELNIGEKISSDYQDTEYIKIYLRAIKETPIEGFHPEYSNFSIQSMYKPSFDNIPEAAYFWPPLTSVQQDLHELGCVAVQQVVRLIEASREAEDVYEPKAVWLEPQLVVRESSQRK